jgi:hypothetical protein
LLADVRLYANHHYRDGKAGLFKTLSQQERIFVPDVRHSAALAKALIILEATDDDHVAKLFRFVIDCALDPTTFESRIPNHAEILAAVDTLMRNPRLRDPTLDDSKLDKARQTHEAALLQMHRPLGLEGQKETSSPAGLFFDSVAGEHMAPYYTWWALDCYGSAMLSSGNPALRSLAESSVSGLLSLETRSLDESAFPLTVDGVPDAGSTAQIAEVLARLNWTRHSQVAGRSLRFISKALADDSENLLYLPFTIWALFSLLSTVWEHGDIRM